METSVGGQVVESTVPDRAHAEAVPSLAAAAAGDLDAFDDLLAPRLDGLYRAAVAILRNEADARDAVQETCVRAWRELRRLRDPERLDAWIGRILLNTCRDMLRSRRRVTVREIDVAQADARQPSGRPTPFTDRLAQIDSIRRAFQRLKPDDRVLIALHHGQQRPLEEIADLLGQPVGTVKWRLHEARKALARALEREL